MPSMPSISSSSTTTHDLDLWNLTHARNASMFIIGCGSGHPCKHALVCVLHAHRQALSPMLPCRSYREHWSCNLGARTLLAGGPRAVSCGCSVLVVVMK